MLLKLSKNINVSIIKNLVRRRNELHLTLKTVNEVLMGMVITWTSPIKNVAEPSLKDKAKTEQETEVKRNAKI